MTDPDFHVCAAAGAGALQRWYDQSTGQWTSTGWWNSANALTAVIGYSKLTGDSSHDGCLAATFAAAQRQHAGQLEQPVSQALADAVVVVAVEQQRGQVEGAVSGQHRRVDVDHGGDRDAVGQQVGRGEVVVDEVIAGWDGLPHRSPIRCSTVAGRSLMSSEVPSSCINHRLTPASAGSPLGSRQGENNRTAVCAIAHGSVDCEPF